MIRLEGVSVLAAGRPLLDTVWLSVDPGQTVLVTGANGAGKSLLARAVAGLVTPSAGKVTVEGVSPRRRRMVGYLPQNGGLYDYLTVMENLRFFAVLPGFLFWKERRACGELLELVGLAGLANQPVSRLTPGQRQRLRIAVALTGDPSALVLDEPMAGLDADARADLRDLLGELSAMGKAILIVAGDPDGLPYDARWLLSEGRLKGGEVA